MRYNIHKQPRLSVHILPKLWEKTLYEMCLVEVWPGNDSFSVCKEVIPNGWKNFGKLGK